MLRYGPGVPLPKNECSPPSTSRLDLGGKLVTNAGLAPSTTRSRPRTRVLLGLIASACYDPNDLEPGEDVRLLSFLDYLRSPRSAALPGHRHAAMVSSAVFRPCTPAPSVRRRREDCLATARMRTAGRTRSRGDLGGRGRDSSCAPTRGLVDATTLLRLEFRGCAWASRTRPGGACRSLWPTELSRMRPVLMRRQDRARLPDRGAGWGRRPSRALQADAHLRAAGRASSHRRRSAGLDVVPPGRCPPPRPAIELPSGLDLRRQDPPDARRAATRVPVDRALPCEFRSRAPIRAMEPEARNRAHRVRIPYRSQEAMASQRGLQCTAGDRFFDLRRRASRLTPCLARTTVLERSAPQHHRTRSLQSPTTTSSTTPTLSSAEPSRCIYCGRCSRVCRSLGRGVLRLCARACDTLVTYAARHEPTPPCVVGLARDLPDGLADAKPRSWRSTTSINRCILCGSCVDVRPYDSCAVGLTSSSPRSLAEPMTISWHQRHRPRHRVLSASRARGPAGAGSRRIISDAPQAGCLIFQHRGEREPPRAARVRATFTRGRPATPPHLPDHVPAAPLDPRGT